MSKTFAKSQKLDEHLIAHLMKVAMERVHNSVMQEIVEWCAGAFARTCKKLDVTPLFAQPFAQEYGEKLQEMIPTFDIDKFVRACLDIPEPKAIMDEMDRHRFETRIAELGAELGSNRPLNAKL